MREMTFQLFAAMLGVDGAGEHVSWKAFKKAMASRGFAVKEAGHKATFIPPREAHARTLTVRKPEGGTFRARDMAMLARQFERALVWNGESEGMARGYGDEAA